MQKYFGTDGIRGEYNKKLTIDLAFEIGKAAGTVFRQNSKVCIAKDPRMSSNILELALSSGLCATGVNVVSLGVTSTPNISYTILNEDFDYGIMISASHNPYTDNGIKFFGSNGSKLSDHLELEIEQVLTKKDYNLVNTEKLGIFSKNKQLVSNYEDYLTTFGIDLTGINICIDCANGSSFMLAKSIFTRLGASVDVIGNDPSGININDGIGSTHPKRLQAIIKEGNYDFGFAYDGDADRIILFDQEGTILDGDYILYLLASYFKSKGQLKNNVVISTVMANLGFIKALDKLDITVVQASVGDRYVMQEINNYDAVVGGEQSGHIILPQFLPTGDGLLVSVFLSKLIVESELSLSQLISKMKKFPQVLVNKQVVDKNAAMTDPQLLSVIDEYEKQLGNSGRILVRASGTEELIRVMVEAENNELCNTIANDIITYVK